MELTKELKGEGTPDDGIRLFNATGLENLNMIRKRMRELNISKTSLMSFLPACNIEKTKINW